MNDERLARRAASGDRGAFEAIFKRYHQDLFRFCLATLGNPQDAQDALQNTMVKVLRALPGEEREIKLKPWLYRIARNEALELLRRERPSVELEAESMSSGSETAESAAARERLRELLCDLEQLPERQRAALVMRELAGLEFAEIGEAFGTTPAVARQTLYEARQGLSQMEAGREMSCETVRRTLSDADGRVTRRRDVRAHLRRCSECRAFQEGIARRRGEFAAIAPLPLAASAGILQSLLGGAASAGNGAAAAAAGAAGVSGGGGLAATVGAGAGKVLATSAIVKSAATVAVVAVGVSAAERGGVIDLPVSGGGTPAKSPPPQGEPAGSGTDGGPIPAEDRSAGEAGAGPAAGRNRPDAGGRANGLAASARKGPSPPGLAAKGPPSTRTSPGKGRAGQPRGARPKGERGGRPRSLPPAAAGGQATAAERKPPAAESSPGPGGEAAGKAPTAAKPAPRPVRPAPPAGPVGSPPPPPLPGSAKETPAAPGAPHGGKGKAEVEASAPPEATEP